MANQQWARRHAGASPRIKRWLVSLGLLIAVFPILLLLAIGFALRLPASILDSAMSAISQDAVRLVLPAGQIRSGHAELWVRDAARREWQPWMPIDWTLTPEWRDGDLGLLLVSNVGTVRLDRAGLSMRGVRISLPPNLLLAGVNHPLAKAPWRGDIELVSNRLDCDWAILRHEFPSCDGQASLRWRGMGSAILPLKEIGSYAALIAAESQTRSWRADISTESGIVAIKGGAEIKSGAVSYRIAIKGENELMAGLNSVAGPDFKRQGNSGEFLLEGGW